MMEKNDALSRTDMIYCTNLVKWMVNVAKQTTRCLESEEQRYAANMQSEENARSVAENTIGYITALAAYLMATADNLSSTMLGDGYNDFWSGPKIAPDWCFGAAMKDNRLLVKLPPLPVAPYRSRLRGSPITRPIRFPQLAAMLDKLPKLEMEQSEPLVLFLLHVVPKEYSFRRIPDFDNFDVKSTIDMILGSYGGDVSSRYTLVHSTVEAGNLSAGTYALLSTKSQRPPDLDTAIAVLAEQFPFTQFCTHEVEYTSLRRKLEEPPELPIPEATEFNPLRCKPVILRPSRKANIINHRKQS